ncbi:MAG: type II secretion system protein [Planctomycetota bacterium]|jgi:prepilin-type N-terminal cleavage/methylation domain-containing protein
MSSKGKRGFTLIELLVVISIIALLLSILMPGLQLAKAKAKATICRSNLKQWGTVVLLYANDNNDSFWTGNNESLPPEIWKKSLWTQALRPYYSAVDDFRLCPSASRLTYKTPDEYATDPDKKIMGNTKYAWGTYDDSWQWTEPGDFGSYGNNGYCSKPGPGIWTYDDGYTWNKVTVSGAYNIPVFMDMTWMSMWPHHDGHTPPANPDDPAEFFNEMSRPTMDRHNGAINVQFLDYSVRKVGIKTELWKLRWSRHWDTANAKTKRSYKWPEWLEGFK